MPETAALAKRLKRIREVMELNQGDFADSCGISIEALSLWERGQGNPTLEALKLIAAFTGMTVSDLVQVDESLKLHKDIKISS